jgi:hypothetical protein
MKFPSLPGVLDEMERISEILFGLIMVLTFTGSLSATGLDRGEVRNTLIGALGCNLAWGIIDALMYLMACFGEQGRRLLMLRSARKITDPGEAHKAIAAALPPVVASVLNPSEFEAIRKKLNDLPELPVRPRLRKEDWVGAAGVFLWVFVSTLPVVIPFTIIGNHGLALRVSNAVAIVMLFLCGYAFGRHSGHRPWGMGLLMVVIGLVMVGITIALGG